MTCIYKIHHKHKEYAVENNKMNPNVSKDRCKYEESNYIDYYVCEEGMSNTLLITSQRSL